VNVEQRDARPTAVVRKHTTWAGLPSEWRPMLDGVYTFVRAGGVQQDGHNVMFFRDVAEGGVGVEVGVEAAGPFEATGSVVPSELPAGPVVAAVPRGLYDRLGETDDAIQKWATANGLNIAGPRWEIYGDWSEDENALETEIVYLVA
jgi:effector-binding domain-containing protein